MPRPIPSSSSSSSGLPLPLAAAGAAAGIAVFFSLCISHHRKFSSSSPKSQPPSPSSSSSSSSSKKIETTPPKQIQDHENMHSHSPPVHGPIGPVSPLDTSKSQVSPLDTSKSQRRLSASLSIRLTEGLSKIRTNNNNKNKKEKVKEEKAGEESVWMKTIILGERCKVPRDDEEDGKKRKNYHPRTPRSVPVSRTNSFAWPQDPQVPNQ